MKRKTSITKIASILTVLAMVWGGGVACQQPTEPEAPVEPTKYTISFDSGVESITVEEGAVATEPTTAPEKTGYTFGGWLNGDAAYDWTQPVTSNLSLTAKWTPTVYTIDYKLPEGSTNDESNLVEYTIESETISELKDPKLPEGLTFLGWYTDDAYTVAFESIEKGSTGNVVIYAKYTDKQTFTVTYYIGDKANTKPEEKDAVFKLTGYDLFTDKECTKAYKDPITSDITLYAKVKEYKVTFNSDGGSEVAAKTVEYNKTITEPTAPTKDGFDFAGWYEGETKFNFATKITKDISLTAKWEEKKAEDPTTPPASGEDDVEEETPKITYLVEKATTEFTVSNKWSQANISGMDKEYKKGDWIVTGGTVSIDGTKKIGQVYLQFGIDGGSKQIGGYYQADSSKTSTSYTFYWIYRVDEDFKATYAQVACQEESGGNVVALAQDSKFTVSDFYVVHLPKADMAKLTTEIKVADTIEMPYKDHGADNGKGYQLDLEAVNFTTTEGKIVCLYKRPAVKNGYKNHFINGGYVAKGENGYTAVYPDLAAGLISITRDVAAGNTCNWFQIGIVGQDTTEGDTLAITDLEVRIIPNF